MAYINVDEVYILDNTGLQVDMATDIPFADAGFTDAQKEQARANIAAGGTNPNLLDNPFFRINQMSFTSQDFGSSGNGYTVDRWKGYRSVVSVQADLSLNVTPNSNDYGIAQFIEADRLVVGKVYTVSVDIGGTIFSWTFTYSTSAEYSFRAADGSRFYRHTGSNMVDIWIIGYANTTYNVRSFKLELGSVSTLANDAPPKQSQENDDCKWYFERIKALSGNYAPMGFGYATSATLATIFVPMHAKRDSGYTVSTSGSFRLVNGATTYTVTAISKYASVSNNLLALTVTSSGLTAGQPLEFGARGDGSAYIDVNDNL